MTHVEASLQMIFEPMWPYVRKTREQVGTALERCPPALRTAAMMTASELVENAIKYGESVDAAPSVRFSLEATTASIRICVANGSTNAAGVAELRRRIDELSSTSDKRALYYARLEELLAHPGESGKLGIFRIGYEGGFDLHFEYANAVVIVTATRKRNG